jgi:Nif-specific regulatory protein
MIPENGNQAEDSVLDQLRHCPMLLPTAIELLFRANEAADPAEWLTNSLPRVAVAGGGDYSALVAAVGGRWAVVAEASTLGPIPNRPETPRPKPPNRTPTGNRPYAPPLPADLLAEVLDRETAQCRGDWAAAPLAPRDVPVEAIVVHHVRPDETAAGLSALQCLAPVFREALKNVRKRHQNQQRIRRLETVLDIANQWNQTHELEPLLNQMAEAATRLLGADRASIFLWDKPNHCLVGRPALGVKGGELRIPDDRGVVGQVIQTGLPRRVDAAAEPDAVNRQVDAQLHYRTRTLLCVPLRTKSGELFGAFEVINRLSGSFTQEDEDALVELAAPAAVALENAQDRQRLLRTNRQLAEQAAEGTQLIGESRTINALRSIVRRVADTDLAVLILGENGTGKEVVARSIHYLTRRRDQPFIAVNCAAIPETLAESELFGHEKGAFTDAKDARPGKFELASGGTLFLDEIGDLSLACQAKLLRVLEEKVMVRVGGSNPIHTDARVLAATNQNLAEMVRSKKFREDLYFRLNVVTLDLPPLRDRAGDILLLAQHFLADFCTRARRKAPELTPAAQQRLEAHPWPGNVRELRNLMERLAYLSTGDRIEAEDLAFILSPRGQPSLVSDLSQTLADATSHFQTEYIRRMIESSSGHMSHAAERLGLHRSNLYRKMRQLGMETPE